MTIKTRKRSRVSRTQLNITWKKGEDEEKRRFEKAVEITGANANGVIRGLMKEWVDLVLAEPPAIKAAAEKFVKKGNPG